MSSPTVYTDNSFVIRELGLQQSSTQPNYYFIWQLPVSIDTINQFVQQANEYTTALFPDLTSDNIKFPLARQYATKLAALRLIQEMAINWQVSGMTAVLGNITVNRLAAMKEGITQVRYRLQEDLNKIYTLLTEIETIDPYSPVSSYEDTHGGFFWG